MCNSSVYILRGKKRHFSKNWLDNSDFKKKLIYILVLYFISLSNFNRQSKLPNFLYKSFLTFFFCRAESRYGVGIVFKNVPTLFSNLASKDNLFMSKDKKLNSLLYFTENELKKKKINWAVFKKEIQLNLISVSMLDKTLNCMLCHVLRDSMM